MTQLNITGPAERDLDELWLYLAGEDVAIADRFVDELYEKALLIAGMP